MCGYAYNRARALQSAVVEHQAEGEKHTAEGESEEVVSAQTADDVDVCT
jgi:hypothetical protein